MPGCFKFSCNNYFGNHFRYIASYHMCSKPFTILCIKDYFNESIGIATGLC